MDASTWFPLLGFIAACFLTAMTAGQANGTSA